MNLPLNVTLPQLFPAAFFAMFYAFVDLHNFSARENLPDYLNQAANSLTNCRKISEKKKNVDYSTYVYCNYSNIGIQMAYKTTKVMGDLSYLT